MATTPFAHVLVFLYFLVKLTHAVLGKLPVGLL